MIRDLILRLMPASWRAAAEAESREWHMVCTRCGHAASIWDRGGLRFKAAGRPLARAHCAGCAQVTVARIERWPGGRRPPGPDGAGGANPA
ncbi:MAG: hypothetical protein KF887_15345 [Paracoccaceae bacterium]|nr:MAG: hypothetical protein KF887_15345 [Paracoccaceae bacterium]